MRITGGEYCGRGLKVPKSDDIRPTQDRVREALFNILAPEIAGATFLDLFAGSGAVGIEALSRGASAATFIERNPRHIAVLRENLAAIRYRSSSEVKIMTSDAYSYISSYNGEGFDIGFADPPYALGETEGYAKVLDILMKRNVIRLNGLFIAEMTAVQKAEETAGWELLRDRTYGKTRVCIWRRMK